MSFCPFGIHSCESYTEIRNSVTVVNGTSIYVSTLLVFSKIAMQRHYINVIKELPATSTHCDFTLPASQPKICTWTHHKDYRQIFGTCIKGNKPTEKPEKLLLPGRLRSMKGNKLLERAGHSWIMLTKQYIVYSRWCTLVFLFTFVTSISTPVHWFSKIIQPTIQHDELAQKTTTGLSMSSIP